MGQGVKRRRISSRGSSGRDGERVEDRENKRDKTRKKEREREGGEGASERGRSQSFNDYPLAYSI